MKRVVGTVFSATLALWPPQSHGCACCAYPGQWSVSPTAVVTEDRTWFRDELARLRLVGTLESAEHGQGSQLLTERYRVEAAVDQDTWRVVVHGATTGKPLATLTLQSGLDCEEFKADIGRQNPSGETELYKEWRFVGRIISDSPRFPIAAGHATLVLQGYGNNCVNAGDFVHWVLNFQVTLPPPLEAKPGQLENVTAHGRVEARSPR